MGTLAPMIGTLAKTVTAVSTISNAVNQFSGYDTKALKAQQSLALQNLQAQQNLSEQQAKEKAKLEKARLALQAQQAEDARRKALKRAIAKRNASVGASGAGRSGSNEAVLLGLINEADDIATQSSQLDQLRYKTIDQNLDNLQTGNILQRSQLAAKQRLAREISSY